MSLRLIKNISLHAESVEKKREEIKQYFNNTYSIYEELFELLSLDEAYYKKAIETRHPLIFYYGHTAAFFINKLNLAKIIDSRVNPLFESIFAVGVDEMSWDNVDENSYKWPKISEVKRYRDQVREVVNRVIDTTPLSLPISWDSPFWVILMGCEHEKIHLETSSVLMRQLPLKYIKKSNKWRPCRDSEKAPQNKLIKVDEGDVLLGKSFDSDFYSWDNEYGSYKSRVLEFKASKFLVSNGEFLEFVKDSGYKKSEFWEDEGKNWLKKSEATIPTFWQDSGKKLRLLTEIIDLPLNHPVEVNYHEAKAYCNWLSKKEGKNIALPTEAQWRRLIDISNVNEVSKANINLEYFASTTPVDRFKFGKFYDLIGNVWQWSQTAIYPFDGFKTHKIYDDFTTPTFDTKHNLIKGGSWISSGNEILLSARYAFRRHFFQHAGFRYVENSYIEDKPKYNIYESDESVNQYIEFGWGEDYFGVKNYPKQCVEIALKYMKNREKNRALDIGCAIGRSTFELAQEFKEAVGVDFTARFISVATKLKEDKNINYSLPIEGNLKLYKSLSLLDFNLENVAQKVSFWQGDACNLNPSFTGFDLIFAGNLIDRLYDPEKFLKDISHRLNHKAIFVLTSPYTWSSEFTSENKWLCQDNKESLETIKEILSPNFNLLDIKDIEFVIRESKRKYQHSIAQMSIWEKI